jgi:hypothetical protein
VFELLKDINDLRGYFPIGTEPDLFEQVYEHLALNQGTIYISRV